MWKYLGYLSKKTDGNLEEEHATMCKSCLWTFLGGGMSNIIAHVGAHHPSLFAKLN